MENKRISFVCFLLFVVLTLIFTMSSCERKSGRQKVVSERIVDKYDTVDIVFDSIKSVITADNSFDAYIVYNNGEYVNELLKIDYSLANKINLATKVNAKLKLHIYLVNNKFQSIEE